MSDPTDFAVTPINLKKKNRPTTTDFHIGGRSVVVGGKNRLVGIML